MHQNPFSRRGSAPDPAGGAYDAPPDPLVGLVPQTPSPFPSLLDAFGVSNSAPTAFGAYGASVLRPPSTQNPGYANEIYGLKEM